MKSLNINNFQINLNFQKHKYYQIYSAHYYILGNIEDAQLSELLIGNYNKLEIGWGLIKVELDNVVIVSDRLRTYPIFYRLSAEEISLTDNCNDLITDDIEINKYCCCEYRSSGFVRGFKTIYEEIFQSEAASIISIDLVNPINIERSYYFQYYSNFNFQKDYNKCLIELNKIVENTIFEIKEKFSNKRILIPLSSGFDSRFIAYMVKKSGVQDVICFTYGKERFHEVQKARLIAEKLDLPWIHVPYSNKVWVELRNDIRFNQYLNNSSWIGSLAHIQDWPAIDWLLQNGYIHEDCIIIPGHTGDFISGGHIPKALQSDSATIDDLLNFLLKKHYRVHIPNWSASFGLRLKGEIEEYLFSYQNNSDKEFCSKFIEQFDWAERQSKFIVNSINVYKFFNLQWYLPLWSKDQIDFWIKIPVEYKFNKKLYLDYLSTIDAYSIFTEVVPKSTLSNYNKLSKLRILKRKLTGIHLKLKKQYFTYFTDGLGWYALFSYSTVIRKKNFQNINSFIVDKVFKNNMDKKNFNTIVQIFKGTVNK